MKSWRQIFPLMKTLYQVEINIAYTSFHVYTAVNIHSVVFRVSKRCSLSANTKFRMTMLSASSGSKLAGQECGQHPCHSAVNIYGQFPTIPCIFYFDFKGLSLPWDLDKQLPRRPAYRPITRQHSQPTCFDPEDESSMFFLRFGMNL